MKVSIIPVINVTTRQLIRVIIKNMKTLFMKDSIILVMNVNKRLLIRVVLNNR